MIYLDHNASTPVRPEVAEAMARVLSDVSANPSSAHREGQQARAAVERARAQVAALVHAREDEVTFVSGGTEGDHAALVGSALASQARGRRVAVSAIEHHAVHGAAALLARLGFQVAHVPATGDGLVRAEAIAALPADTTVLAVMLANNETGVVQPVPALAGAARARGIALVCDAVQAAGKMPVDADALGAEFVVISGHKFGGPKGAGALIVRRGAPYEPLLRGSAHEGGRRGGTENVPGIVGLGLAAELAARELAAESARIAALRERLEAGVRARVPDAVFHGPRAPRLPNTSNVSFPGARSDHLLMALDARGIAVSAGAACASGAVEPSPVLSAMGVPRALAVCALRFSLGRTSTDADVDATLAALETAVPAARALAPAGAA
ncbi:MAG TPA: cysteine desulfurase family protein [Candidatus Eisenbacteria bacterium]|nr:cysteine desulfurase family protein [Candidatus Eisenbacteria bacterium]